MFTLVVHNSNAHPTSILRVYQFGKREGWNSERKHAFSMESDPELGMYTTFFWCVRAILFIHLHNAEVL